MAIPPGVATLAISVVSGALKLRKQLDEIQAEETALRAAVPAGFPSIQYNPSDSALRRELRLLLAGTKDIVPDPLGDDRETIKELRKESGVTAELFAMASKYDLLDSIESDSFKPDAKFRDALLARNGAWDLSDAEIRQYTYFVAAGPDLRRGSLGFRIAATLLDVLAEVAAQNARFAIQDAPTRRLVENILTRFSKPELAELDGWAPMLRHALGSTLNAVIDERTALAERGEWIEHALAALARARDGAPNGDDFVLGLFRGRGVDALLGGLLTEASIQLSDGDVGPWENILADVLLSAAAKAEDVAGFDEFFRDHWHSLVAAGFASLQVHGPKLLAEDDAILRETLIAAVAALADAFDDGPPNSATFAAVAEAAISVFADPGVLEADVRQPWLRELIASVAGAVRDAGLRAAFSQTTLERYAREALDVLSRYPEVLAEDGTLVQDILAQTLGKMSEVETFAAGPLADAAVEGTLTAIAANPALLDDDYAQAIGDLAGALAHRVARGGIGSLHAEALLGDGIEGLAMNSELFLRGREGLAATVIGAVLDAIETGDPKQLIAGAGTVALVDRVLAVIATHGRLLPTDLDEVESSIRELITAGIAEAQEALGKRLAQENVPDVLVELIRRMATGEGLPDVGSAELATLVRKIVDEVTASVA